MKIKIRTINGIPRLMIRYKAFNVNRQLTWRNFTIPTKFSTFWILIRDVLFNRSIIYKNELGILLSHDDIYKKKDVILAVGLGSGISLIHNCIKEREDNSFIGIEASLDQIEITLDNALLNGINSNKFKIIQGYVGSPNNIYGNVNQQSLTAIDINNFDYDVLELDCEGSEIDILYNLKKEPRHIIVEMHSTLRIINIDELIENMNFKGYSLVKIYTVYGDIVSINKMGNYFTKDRIEMMMNPEYDSGNDMLVLNFELDSSRSSNNN